MATLIKPDGTETPVTPATAKKGFSLTELYALIGCSTVQRLRLGMDTLWVDEEAKLKPGWRERINGPACIRWGHYLHPGDCIVGNVVLMERSARV